MKKLSLTVLFSLLSISTAALAQDAASGEIRESTDPAKIAEIERRAQELATQQQSASQQTMDGASGKSAAKPHKRQRGKGMAKSGRNADAASGSSAGAGSSDAATGK